MEETQEPLNPDPEAIEDGEVELEIVTPVIVDLGKTKKKHIKRLKKGHGRLTEELLDVLEEVAEQLGDELEGKTLVPIIMLYEKKSKKKRTITLPF